MKYIVNNNISFKGMSSAQVKRFIPTIADENAMVLSRMLEQSIPRAILEAPNKNEVQHWMNLGDGVKTLMGRFIYKGPDDEVSRIRFLSEVESKIKQGLDYKI